MEKDTRNRKAISGSLRNAEAFQREKQRLEKELELTNKLIKNIKINKNRKLAEEFIDTIKRYYEDAKYYYKKNDMVSAMGCLNYAHGWLDAGIKAGVLTNHRNRRFREMRSISGTRNSEGISSFLGT